MSKEFKDWVHKSHSLSGLLATVHNPGEWLDMLEAAWNVAVKVTEEKDFKRNEEVKQWEGFVEGMGGLNRADYCNGRLPNPVERGTVAGRPCSR